MQKLELAVPPLAQVLIAGVAMLACARVLPGLAFPYPAPFWLPVLLAALACALIALGVWQFRAAATTVDPRDPDKSSTLVTGGIYRFTRNPMYLGMLVLLLGWGVYLASLPALIFLPGFVMYMNRFQIRPEEHSMRQKFGDAYAQYRAQVRRWL